LRTFPIGTVVLPTWRLTFYGCELADYLTDHILGDTHRPNPDKVARFQLFIHRRAVIAETISNESAIGGLERPDIITPQSPASFAVNEPYFRLY
jgi:hypothetical protein